MKKARILGVALIAALVVSGLAAVNASADEFTAESYPVTLTGSGGGAEESNFFQTTAGNTACAKVTYGGSATGATTTQTVFPAFFECTSMGFAGVVDMNSCGYLLHLNGGGSTEGTVDIACSKAGDEITGTAIQIGTPKCTYHVPPQTGLTGVKFSTIGAGTTREVKIQAEVKNVKYTHTKGTGLAACAAGSGTNGVFKATIVMTGEPSGGGSHVGVFLS